MSTSRLKIATNQITSSGRVQTQIYVARALYFTVAEINGTFALSRLSLKKKNRCNLIHATLRELRLKSGSKLYSFQRQEDKDQKGKSMLNGTHLLWGSIQRGMRAGSGRDGR